MVQGDGGYNLNRDDDRRNELLELQNRLTTNLNRSLASLQGSFEKFTNPLTRLTDSIQKADKTNIAALKVGITNEKLTKSVNENSRILTKNLTSNNELKLAIIDGFGRGVRVQTDALSKLTTEMVATNQNTGALNKLNSDLILFTGNNIQSLDNAAKVNKEVSDAYGVSNDKLINTLNTLRETLQTASFFGTNAVDSLSEVAQQLTGRAGGTDITGALGALNRLLVGGIETERAGAILGATGVRQRIAGGGRVTLQDIIPILDQLESRRASMGGGRFGLDILSQTLGFSKTQTVELLNLSRIAREDFRVNDEMKKTTNETFNTIENINRKAENFYDNTAMAILGGIGSINTNLAFVAQAALTLGPGAAAARAAGGAPVSLLKNPKAAIVNAYRGSGVNTNARIRTILKKGVGGSMLAAGAFSAGQALLPEEMSMTNMLGAGDAALGSFIPGVGTLAGGIAGGILGGLADIARYALGSSEAEKKQLEIMEEERRERKAKEALLDVENLRFLTGFVRSRMSMDPSETSERYLELLVKGQNRMERKMLDSKTSIGRK